MVLRRIKNSLKKAVKKRSPSARASARSAAAGQKRDPRRSEKNEQKQETVLMPKEMLGQHEMMVEKTKFSNPETKKRRRILPSELPQRYERDMMVLQVRDPWWLHCYWEVASSTWNGIKERLHELVYSAKRVLRVYDVSNIIFNGKNANRFFDVEVGPESMNWYIDTRGPGRSWCVDYGLKLATGEFVTILRSNTVSTPLDAPSWMTDEEWMIPEEIFARLYGLGFGMGSTSPTQGWQERMKESLSSGILSSPGLASGASPVKKKSKKDRKFWLVADCELIVYGATEPDAAVTVQGKPIRLRPDGTFTLRFALPDGKQEIPIKAVSADGIEERSITPVVSRETSRYEKVDEEALAKFHSAGQE